MAFQLFLTAETTRAVLAPVVFSKLPHSSDINFESIFSSLSCQINGRNKTGTIPGLNNDF